MNYLQRNKLSPARREGVAFKVVFILVFFSLLFLSSYFFPNALRTAVMSAAKPVWAVSGAVSRSFSSTFSYFGSKKSLALENQSLRDQVAVLSLKQIDHDTLVKENETLKSELGRGVGRQHLVSAVLSKPPVSPFDTFIIDVGSSDGASVGDKVYISDNVIIGYISAVNSGDAIVTLYSSPGQKQQMIVERTSATFEVSGHGGANFTLETPKDTDIVWGDVFTFPQLSSIILGSVYYVDTSSQSSFKTVYIRAPGNIFQTKFVFVERKP